MVTKFVTPEIPASLRICADAPQKPQGTYQQRQVARYVISLYRAHADCRLKLRAVDRLLTSADKAEK